MCYRLKAVLKSNKENTQKKAWMPCPVAFLLGYRADPPRYAYLEFRAINKNFSDTKNKQAKQKLLTVTLARFKVIAIGIRRN